MAGGLKTCKKMLQDKDPVEEGPDLLALAVYLGKVDVVEFLVNE